MDLKKNLRERCHVNTNDDGDRFVGVKADSDDAVIYFPIGYQLPDNDDDLRNDINNLFGVLAVFMKEDKVIESLNLRLLKQWIFQYMLILLSFEIFCRKQDTL